MSKYAGFCFGVKNAIDNAFLVSERKDKKIFCYGPLIHNDLVNKKLTAKGVIIADSIDEIEDNSIVILRSHGVPKKTYEELESKGAEIVDCTCKFVKNIHEICARFATEKVKTIVVGDKNHPEVQGILGHCGTDSICIENDTDATSVICDSAIVVSQTTFNGERYDIIKKLLEKQCKTVEFFNTICYTTKVKQTETQKLAEQSDLMIVIGDKKSNNTKELYNISKVACDNVLLVHCADELKDVKFDCYNNIGVTAGASTPSELIQEVLIYMSETQDKVTNSIEPTMDELMAMEDKKKKGNYGAGKRVEAMIISVTDAGIKVDLSDSKKDGFIDKDDVTTGEFDVSNYPIGSKIKAIFIDKKNNEGCLSLSAKAIEIEMKNEEEDRAIFSQPDFSFTFKEKVKGGLKGRKGNFELFLPSSQIKVNTRFISETDLDQYVGKPLRLRVIEEKPGKKGVKSLIVSQKVILEEERSAKEEIFWDSIHVDDIVNAKVKRIGYTKAKDADGNDINGSIYGVFVRYNDHDCLVHISDISYVRIDDPTTVLELNKNYDFIVKDLNKETGKISLGYKQLQKSPAMIFNETYKIGDIIKGAVVKIVEKGAYVNILPRVDGFLHVSEICNEYVKKPEDKIKEGDIVEAKIIDIREKKISLSMKALLEVPYDETIVEDNADNTEFVEKKKAERKARFDKVSNNEVVRKPRRDSEPREENEYYSSGNSTTTLADLFKDFKIADNDDEE